MLRHFDVTWDTTPVNVHVYAKGEHVGSIENGVKNVKERTRAMCNSVPYNIYFFDDTNSGGDCKQDYNLFSTKNE